MARRLISAGMISLVLVLGLAQGCNKTQTVKTNLTIHVQVRPLGSTSAADWTSLCQTPGVIRVPAGQELGLGLFNPQTLGLVDQPFGDAELGQLATDFAGITNPIEIGLGSTNVTDAGLAHLAGLPSLRTLFLGHSGVTDSGLAHLAGLTNLRDLYLNDTGVTDTGIATLQGKLPSCKIHRYAPIPLPQLPPE